MYFVFSHGLKLKATPMQGIACFHKNTEINIRGFVVYSMTMMFFIKEFACNYALCT